MLMYMYMLTKHVHILFEKEDYKILKMLAKEQMVSVGELVRRAVRKYYIIPRLKSKKKLGL